MSEPLPSRGSRRAEEDTRHLGSASDDDFVQATTLHALRQVTAHRRRCEIREGTSVQREHVVRFEMLVCARSHRSGESDGILSGTFTLVQTTPLVCGAYGGMQSLPSYLGERSRPEPETDLFRGPTTRRGRATLPASLGGETPCHRGFG